MEKEQQEALLSIRSKQVDEARTLKEKGLLPDILLADYIREVTKNAINLKNEERQEEAQRRLVTEYESICKLIIKEAETGVSHLIYNGTMSWYTTSRLQDAGFKIEPRRPISLGVVVDYCISW